MLSHPQVRRVLRVEQISDALAVDLHVADLHRVLRVRIVVLINLFEEVLAESRDDALILIVLFPHHSVGLSGAGLSIGEDADVVTLESVFEHLFAEIGVDALLAVESGLAGLKKNESNNDLSSKRPTAGSN